MKLLLRLALLLTALTLLESAVVIYTKSSGPCKDHTDRTMHKFGSKWRNSDCQICKCLHTVVTCQNSCSTSYPDDCVAVFERQNCRYRIHKKNDPSVQCQVWEVVQKRV